MSLPEKPIIFISGANKGLGLATVELTCERHPDVIILAGSRDVAAGEKAIAEMRAKGITGGTVRVVKLDVTNDEYIEEVVKWVEKEYGRVDVLINNAGALIRPPGETLAEKRRVYNASCDLNFTSVAIMTTAFLPLLRRSPSPRIVNVTSGGASIARMLTRNYFQYPQYGAVKTGLNGLTVGLFQQENGYLDGLEKKEEEEGKPAGAVPRTQMYAVAPGLLKTALSGFSERAKDPKEGAEVVSRLALMEKAWPGGKQLEWVDGEIKEIPW